MSSQSNVARPRATRHTVILSAEQVAALADMSRGPLSFIGPRVTQASDSTDIEVTWAGGRAVRLNVRGEAVE